MARKGRRTTGRRNVLIVLALAVLFGLAIPVVLSLSGEAPRILPDDPEAEAAMFASNENAYPLLVEALGALPDKTPAAFRNLRAFPLNNAFYLGNTPELKLGSVFALMPKKKPTRLRGYLLDSDAAAASLERASRKPYLRFPPDRSVGAGYRMLKNTLLPFILGRAMVFFDAGRPEEGLAHLATTIRLCRLSNENYAMANFYSGIEQQALAFAFSIAQATASAADLNRVQAFLRDLGPPYQDRRGLVRGRWKAFDDRLTEPRNLEGIPIWGRIRYFAFVRRTRVAVVHFIHENKKTFLEKAEDGPAPLLAWLDEARAQYGIRGRAADPLRGIWAVIFWAGENEAYYEAARIGVVLEQYRRAHGGYPDRLDALSPGYLEAVPRDPLSNSRFVYERVNGLYRLYSVNYDGIDQGGKKHDDMMLIGPLGTEAQG